LRQPSRIRYLPWRKAIHLGITHGCRDIGVPITHVKIGQIRGFPCDQTNYLWFREAKSNFKRKRFTPFAPTKERLISLTDGGWCINIWGLECPNLRNFHPDTGNFSWR
jgi:hypothetical protein